MKKKITLASVLWLLLALMPLAALATTVVNNGYTATAVAITAGQTTATDPLILTWPDYRGVSIQMTATATLTVKHQCLVNSVWTSIGVVSVPISPVVLLDEIDTYCEQYRELVYGGAGGGSITVRYAGIK